MQPILVIHPLELVQMGYLTIESGKGDKDVNVLVITDHFTRYAQDMISNSETTKATAEALGDKFIVCNGLP